MTSVTSTQITYTVTAVSLNASKLTWQNIRVRPTSGTPLAGGSLTRSGAASVVGLPTGTDLGTLLELAGAPGNLVIVTQPSATANAGVPFAQQPALEVRDQFGNLRTSDNSTVLTAARLAGSGTLQGTTSMTAAYGIVTFTNLSHTVATNITVNFTSGGLTNAISSSVIVVYPYTFSKLQLLVPGETAAPGTATGKTGTPSGQNVTSDFFITVNAVDANWNRVSTVTDLIGITSSDPIATLPANTNLSGGTQSLDFTFNTSGSQTITASDLTDGSKIANTSAVITVGNAEYVAATGGSIRSAGPAGRDD